MTSATFLRQMGIVSLFTAVLLVILYAFMPFQPYWGLGVLSLVLFVVLTLLMFFFGKRAATSSNRNAFTSLILAITAIKMFVAIGAVFIYVSIARPTSRTFVIPFLIVYFIYTVYETYMLTALGREQPPQTRK